MSTGRVLWIIWCLLWAGAWSVDVAVTFGDPAVHSSVAWRVLAVVMAGGSLAALFLPVGRAEPYEPLTPRRKK